MTRQQEDYLTMSQTTISFLEANESVWNTNVPTADLITKIDATNNSTVDWLAEQAKSHTGVTGGKKDDREGVEDDVHSISNALSFFALTTNNTAVQGAVSTSTRSLTRPSGLKLIGIAQQVLKTAKDNLAAASPYGLTQAMITSLTANLDAFTASYCRCKSYYHQWQGRHGKIAAQIIVIRQHPRTKFGARRLYINGRKGGLCIAGTKFYGCAACNH